MGRKRGLREVTGIGASSPRISLSYPNVISVSHSNFHGLPRGITALRETSILYIETETNTGFMVLPRISRGLTFDQFYDSHEKLSAIENEKTHFFYNIVDDFGRRLFIAQEESHRRGPSRPFDMHLRDADGQIVFTVQRPHSWRLCLWGYKLRGVHSDTLVKQPNGTLLGKIRQDGGQSVGWDICNEKNEVIMRVRSNAIRHLFGQVIVTEKSKIELFVGDVDVPLPAVLIPPPPPGPGAPPPAKASPTQKEFKQESQNSNTSTSKTPGKIVTESGAPVSTKSRGGEPLPVVVPNPNPTAPIGTFNVITARDPSEISKGCVFGLEFPHAFTPESKALILSAAFLADFTFCETRRSRFITWYGSGIVFAGLIILAVVAFLIVILIASFASAHDDTTNPPSSTPLAPPPGLG